MSIYVFLGIVLFLNAMVLPTGDGAPKADPESNNSRRLRCKWIGPTPGTDQWCDVNCNHVPPFCPPEDCVCWPAQE